MPLVERRGRGVGLTAAGQRLARGFRLAATRDRGGHRRSSRGERESGRIAIGAMPLSRARLLPQRDRRASAAHAPRRVIDVVEGSWRELVERLRDGGLDLMIGALRDAAPAGLEQEPLFDDRLVDRRPRRPSARAARPIRRSTSLRGFPWIVGPTGTPLRAQWEAMFAGRPACRPRRSTADR